MCIRDRSKDNFWGGLAGGLVGASIGAYPSAFVGWLVGIGLDMDKGRSAVPLVACMGITAAGTALSTQIGYNLGKNAGNSYIHIPLSGKDSWRISID